MSEWAGMHGRCREEVSMREYDEATLKRLQSVELNILKDFIYLCRKYNLTWFSFAGTAIGALRHKGFIPWDDDIDVCLPRKDYETFLRVADEEFGEKYYIMNAEVNEHYPLTTTRWMVKGTKFREEALKDIDCPLGIFLDIYPFDYVSDDEKEYRRQAFTAWFWSKILILRCVPQPVIAGSGWKVSLAKAVCRFGHGALRLFGVSRRRLYERCKKAMMRYDGEKTGRLSYLCDTNRFWNTIRVEDLYPLRQEPFEDVMVNFPCHIEKMLEQMWPDFMTLPPVEKRKNHYPYELEFGDSLGQNP